MTEVVREILPEVTVSFKKPAKIFPLTTFLLFLSESNRHLQGLSADRHQLLPAESDINLRVQIEDDASELGENEVKEEYGENDFAQSLTHGNIVLSKEVATAEHSEMSAVLSSSRVAPNENPEHVEIKREMADVDDIQ